ncbi:MAG: hypothetical protein HYR85_21830 [Planctomycetes bacterium]|nr:hypothetical protein [Planctomycetota bacterium]MBI3846177.1 hypothetical protein [Planctomycetota bacterium]
MKSTSVASTCRAPFERNSTDAGNASYLRRLPTAAIGPILIACMLAGCVAIPMGRGPAPGSTEQVEPSTNSAPHQRALVVGCFPGLRANNYATGRNGIYAPADSGVVGVVWGVVASLVVGIPVTIKSWFTEPFQGWQAPDESDDHSRALILFGYCKTGRPVPSDRATGNSNRRWTTAIAPEGDDRIDIHEPGR